MRVMAAGVSARVTSRHAVPTSAAYATVSRLSPSHSVSRSAPRSAAVTYRAAAARAGVRRGTMRCARVSATPSAHISSSANAACSTAPGGDAQDAQVAASVAAACASATACATPPPSPPLATSTPPATNAASSSLNSGSGGADVVHRIAASPASTGSVSSKARMPDNATECRCRPGAASRQGMGSSWMPHSRPPSAPTAVLYAKCLPRGGGAAALVAGAAASPDVGAGAASSTGTKGGSSTMQRCARPLESPGRAAACSSVAAMCAVHSAQGHSMHATCFTPGYEGDAALAKRSCT